MKKKLARKIISLTLAIVLLFCMSTTAMATNTQSIDDAIKYFQEKYPCAMISVNEDGTINVVVPNSALISPSSVNSSEIHDPDGGTYDGYYPPSGFVSPDVPVFKSFLPSEMARALWKARTEPNLLDEIADIYTTLYWDADAFIAAVSMVLGFDVSLVTALFLVACRTYQDIRWVNINSLQVAMDNGTDDAIAIQVTSLYNVYAYVYFGWDGEYVSPDPFADWNPTWNSKEWLPFYN